MDSVKTVLTTVSTDEDTIEIRLFGIMEDLAEFGRTHGLKVWLETTVEGEDLVIKTRSLRKTGAR